MSWMKALAVAVITFRMPASVQIPPTFPHPTLQVPPLPGPTTGPSYALARGARAKARRAIHRRDAPAGAIEGSVLSMTYD